MHKSKDANSQENVKITQSIKNVINKDLVPDASVFSICEICNFPASKSCSACHLVKYCSAEHQKEDWSRHKKNCCPFVQKENDILGRCLVATRRIKAGTLIMQETPVFCAPRGRVDDLDSPICLTCCTVMQGDRALNKCSKCGWPVCCRNCEQHKYHSENECEIFTRKKVHYPPSEKYAVYVIYKVIEIIRGLLVKDRDPSLWLKLMSYQYETELGKNKKLFENLPKLRQAFGVTDLGTEGDWCKILGILNVNNFSMNGLRGQNSPSYTGFLFLTASLLAHSCSPNCWWGVSVFPSNKMHIRATVEIQKGELLTIAYTYLYNAFGTHKRQELIQDDGEFTCKCNRCLDPTELGSFVSALICSSCTKGNVLPISPIDSSSFWKCDKCKLELPSELINAKLDDLMTKLEECESIPDMENFIDGNQGISIHKNHWLITEAEDVICKERAGFLGDQMDLGVLDKQIKYCEHLLAVKGLVAPGLSMERARILNHLARTNLAKLDVQIRKKILLNSEEISKEVNCIVLLYEEALQFYKNDPTETPTTEKYGLKALNIIADINFTKQKLLDRENSQEAF